MSIGAWLTAALADFEPGLAEDRSKDLPMPFSSYEDETRARAQIRDCIMRYARGIDRHDPELTITAYHPDAIDDHGYYIGNPRDFAYRTVKTHAHLAAHQHYIVNHLVEFAEDAKSAWSETYYLMVGMKRSDLSVEMGGGRYVDRFTLRDGRWAISERLCVMDWSGNGERLKDLTQMYLAGTQDRTDPSYTWPDRKDRPLRNIIPPQPSRPTPSSDR